MTRDDLFSLMASKNLTLDEAVDITDNCLKSAGILDPAALINAAGPYAFMAAAALPIAGYQAGKMTAKALDAGPADVSKLQLDELASQMRAHIAELKAKQELKKQKIRVV